MQNSQLLNLKKQTSNACYEYIFLKQQAFFVESSQFLCIYAVQYEREKLSF